MLITTKLFMEKNVAARESATELCEDIRSSSEEMAKLNEKLLGNIAGLTPDVSSN